MRMTAIMCAAAWFAAAAPAAAEFAPATAGFVGDLVLKDVAADFEDVGDYDPGHTEFELIQDYVFIGDDSQEWRVPAGTVVNGASIPQALWSYVGGPWSGKYRNAAVLHDFMCVDRSVDSETTHRVFYDALLASGVDPVDALIMYEAVRLGGPSWEVNAFGPSDVVRKDLTKRQLDQIIADARAGRLKAAPRE